MIYIISYKLKRAINFDSAQFLIILFVKIRFRFFLSRTYKKTHFGCYHLSTLK